jgi:putative tryptophan/tyrosine transport system substrate-binding protein
MRRREFITLIGGTAAWPLVVEAQQSRPVRRIAILMDGSEANDRAGLAAFRAQLDRSGWFEGQNLQSTVQFGDGQAGRIRALSAELVKLNPDLIIPAGSTGLSALLSATRSIPIVFLSFADPVAAGIVARLTHPGGNATGFMAYEGSLGTKCLQLITEIAPAARRLLVLNSGNSGSAILLPEIEKAVGTFAMEMTSASVVEPSEIFRAIETASREPDTGMIVLPGSLIQVRSDLIIGLAARHRLPAIYGSGREFAKRGGLLSYAADSVDLFRQTAIYADRVLRGEKPGDLPVQAPTKFELIVNLKTARALGLDVPPTLLLRADEVIE